MKSKLKGCLISSAVALALSAAFLALENRIPFVKPLNLWAYDTLARAKISGGKPPAAIDDIAIVAIDNDTLGKMPGRWPYQRSVFAEVIRNLTAADAKVIAFDFLFLGKSDPEEDRMLNAALADNNRVVLATAMDETGSVNFGMTPVIGPKTSAGIITKLQDDDDIIRRCLTYISSDESPPRIFVSWEMVILKKIGGLKLGRIKGRDSALYAENLKHEKWAVPVDRHYKSFLINFTAHTADFKRLSLYDVYKGEFDRSAVKGRIVLIGFVSSLLGDIHNTPIGWLPGITLNANALLTIYARNFITELPSFAVVILTLLCVAFSTALLCFTDARLAVFIIFLEIASFTAASYALFTMGYMWDYCAFPLCVAILPLLSKRVTG